MTLERRLQQVENSLTPTQAVVRWLDEAQAAGSMGAYTASLFSGPLMPTPSMR